MPGYDARIYWKRGGTVQPVLCTFITCDRVSSNRGKFSLEGVFYRVHPQKFPVRHKCCLVVGWCGAPGRYRFRLRFLSPGDRLVLMEVNDFEFAITAACPYHHTIINAELLLVDEGIYNFEVTLEGQPAGRFPLHVVAAVTPVYMQS